MYKNNSGLITKIKVFKYKNSLRLTSSILTKSATDIFNIY